MWIHGLRSRPPQATQWSQRSLGKALDVSDSTIGRVWRAHGLKPHLVRTFKISTDPKFVEKLEDVIGLYLNAPEHAIVLCCDEKSQVQALDRTQKSLPIYPGLPTEIQDRVIDWLPHDGKHLLLELVEAGSAWPAVYKVNVDTGRRSSIRSPERCENGTLCT